MMSERSSMPSMRVHATLKNVSLHDILIGKQYKNMEDL